MALTLKQLAFCREYLVDLNATQAAIRAGYSPRTAASQGERLLRNVEVEKEIALRIQERAQRAEITAERVLEELGRLAIYDPGMIGKAAISRPEDIEKLPEDLRRAVVGWSWDRAGNFTLKLSDKIRALDLIGQHRGMWKNKIELTGKDGGPVEMEGKARPSPEEVCDFSREAHQAFAAYRDEKTGEAATLGAREITAIAEAVASFASGTDHGQATASQCGEVIARVHCIRRGILAGIADRNAPPES
jgi:phage terminase small subunit